MAALFFFVFVLFKIIIYWSRESPPPFARKRWRWTGPPGPGEWCGLGRSQGNVHISWDGRQSNVLVFLGKLDVTDNSDTFVSIPLPTANACTVYTFPRRPTCLCLGFNGLEARVLQHFGLHWQ